MLASILGTLVLTSLNIPGSQASSIKREQHMSGLYRCGSQMDHPDKYVAMEINFKAEGIPGTMNKSSPVVIPVYFHVINQGAGIENGDVPESQIKQQITVLNNGFVESGLTFVLQNITRTTNANWFHNAGLETPEQDLMKSQLHVGDASTLNVYTVNMSSPKIIPPLLGYATFPSDYASDPTDDGVVLLFTTLPGGSLTLYNLGITGIHEVGHWAGLFHTFTGGCDDPYGDYVDDTPTEAEPSDGCPTGRNTCPGRPGRDPINNYMDYSEDPCQNEFTPGQITRLASQMSTYRMAGAPGSWGRYNSSLSTYRYSSSSDSATSSEHHPAPSTISADYGSGEPSIIEFSAWSVSPTSDYSLYPKQTGVLSQNLGNDRSRKATSVRGLTTGAIIAIAIAGVIVLSLAACIIFTLVRRARRRKLRAHNMTTFMNTSGGSYQPLNDPAPAGISQDHSDHVPLMQEARH